MNHASKDLYHTKKETTRTTAANCICYAFPTTLEEIKCTLLECSVLTALLLHLRIERGIQEPNLKLDLLDLLARQGMLRVQM